MRRLVGSRPLAAAAPRRSVAVFTPQSAVLARNAEECGFGSVTWLQADAEWAARRFGVTPLPNAQPTLIRAAKRFPFFNATQLRGTPKPERAADALADTVVAGHLDGRLFSGTLAKALAELGKQHGFSSPYWCGPAYARRHGLEPYQKARPVVAVQWAMTPFLNADQFDKPESVTAAHFNGATTQPFRSEVEAKLRDVAQLNNFELPIWFTAHQIDALGLRVVPGQANAAAEVSTPGTEFQVFNLDEVANADEVRTALHRFPAREHQYLVSGRPLGPQLLAAAEQAPFRSKDWISRNELLSRKGMLRPDAVGITVSAPGTMRLFNIAQLQDRRAVLAALGKYSPPPRT